MSGCLTTTAGGVGACPSRIRQVNRQDLVGWTTAGAASHNALLGGAQFVSGGALVPHVDFFTVCAVNAPSFFFFHTCFPSDNAGQGAAQRSEIAPPPERPRAPQILLWKRLMGGAALQSGSPPPQLETAARPASVGWHVWCSAPAVPGFAPGSVTLAFVNTGRRARGSPPALPPHSRPA